MRRFIEAWVIKPFSSVGAIALLMLGLVVTAEVALRAFGIAVVGTVEISEILMAVLVFAAIAYTQATDGHVAIEAFINHMPAGYQRVSRAFSLAICAAVSALLTYGAAEEAIHSYIEKEFQFGTMHFPLWPTKSIVAIGLALLTLELLLQTVSAVRGFSRSSAAPPRES